MQKKRLQDLARIDELELETLTDAELERVDGGDSTTAASCSCCVSGATVVIKPPKAI